MRGRICISLSNAVFLSRVQDYRSIKDVKLSDVNARMPTNPAQKRKKKNLREFTGLSLGLRRPDNVRFVVLKQRGPS